MKDARTGGNEDFVFDCAPYYMRIRTHETVVAHAQRMARRTPQNSILHDDAFFAERNRPALGDDLCPIHNSTTRPDRHIAANNGIWCHIGGMVNLRRGAGMLNEHVILSK